MGATLDPEVQALLEAMRAEGGPPMESLSVEEARQGARDLCRRLGGTPAPVARVEDVECSGPAGAIRVRIYRPDSGGPRPALVYFHGGGWVIGDLETHSGVCRAVAHRSGAVVLAVDYRRAPEAPFPAAVEDCFAAARWALENAGALSIDPGRVAVGGDSAEGNLAASVSLKCRDEGGPAFALQVLVYPVTNVASLDTPSYHEFAEGYFLTKSQMEWFARHYCPNPEDRRHPHASPLLAADLGRLPPALVITAECDVLRDEGESYAGRLEAAGVPVTCHRLPGVIHGFLVMQGALRQAREAIDRIAAAVRGQRPAG